MEEGSQFESPEAEIQYLEQKVLEKKRELAEHDSRNVVAETLKSHIDKVPVAPAPPTPTIQDPKDDDPVEKNIALYVQIAFQNGIADAVQKIRDTHNPFLIDAFHDALTDRFLDALRAKGLLEDNV